MGLGIPIGLGLAALGWLPGDALRTPGEVLFGGLVQGLVIGAIVAFGGSWRRRWRADVERAKRQRGGGDGEMEGPASRR